MFSLKDYQQRALDSLRAYFRACARLKNANLQNEPNTWPRRPRKRRRRILVRSRRRSSRGALRAR